MRIIYNRSWRSVNFATGSHTQGSRAIGLGTDLDAAFLPPSVTSSNGSGSCTFSRHIPLASHQLCKPNHPFDKFVKTLAEDGPRLLVKGKPAGAK